MAGLLYGFRASARNVARAAALSVAFWLAAVILGLTGLGFLTAALWLVIATYQGAVFAFAFIGVIYVALGAVFLALAAYPPRETRWRRRPALYDEPPPPREPLVQIVEGFVMGMRAGRAARRPRR